MKRVLFLLVLLSACAAPPAPPSPAPVPAPAAGVAGYGPDAYRIDPQASLIAVTVRRAGLLARLGHDHVVAARTLTGFAAPSLGRADIAFRLDQMSVDEPALLRAAGIETRPSAEAI